MIRKMLRNNWVHVCIFGIVLGGVLIMFSEWEHRRFASRTQRFEAKGPREKEAIKAGFLRRQAIANAATKQSTLSVDTQVPVDTHGIAPHVDRRVVEIVTSGPYLGMTMDAAMAAANKALADGKASAKRKHEWKLRYDAASQKMLENIEKSMALGDVFTANANEEKAAMLSALSMLSPEQLDYARQELLKTQPVDEVDAFFDAIA